MWFDEDINLVIETDPFINVSGSTSFSQIDNISINIKEDPIFIKLSEYYAPVQSVNGKIGFVNIDKSDIGLSNVENISIVNTSGYLQNNIFTTGLNLNLKIDSLSGNLTSDYATITNLKLTGSTLDTKINSFSGHVGGYYATITNLALTGSTLQSQINNLNSSGFITSSNVVYTTGSQLIDGEKNFTLLKRSNINVAVIPTWKNIFDTNYPTTFWNIDTLQLAPERNVIYYTPASWEAPFTRHIRLPKSGNFAGDSLIVSTNYMPASSKINFYKYDPGPGWVLIDSWENSSFDGLYRPFSLSMITYQNSNEYNTPWIKQSNRWNITPPASINSNGTPGDLSFDGTNIYVCVGQNNWRRLSASTWS